MLRAAKVADPDLSEVGEGPVSGINYVAQKRVVALKAVAHKLARACYHMIYDNVNFDVSRAFVYRRQQAKGRGAASLEGGLAASHSTLIGTPSPTLVENVHQTLPRPAHRARTRI